MQKIFKYKHKYFFAMRVGDFVFGNRCIGCYFYDEESAKRDCRSSEMPACASIEPDFEKSGYICVTYIFKRLAMR